MNSKQSALGNLSLNMLLALLGLATVLPLLLVYSSFIVIAERNTNAKLIAESGQAIATRLAAEMEYSMWDYNYSNATMMLKVEANNPDIRHITLYDNRGSLVVDVIRRDDATITATLNQLGDDELRNSDVVGVWKASISHFEIGSGKIINLGHIEVAMSDRQRGIELLARLVQAIVTQLAFSMVTIGFFYIAIQRLIVRRIVSLYQVISEFANFRFTTQAKDNRMDEIGRLAQRFNTMAALIQKYAMDMEAQVNERTAQLVESEKLAFLGGLVAGIAHEINTPVGTSVTAVTYLENRVQEVKAALASGSLTRSAMDAFLDEVVASSALVSANLNRTSELVQAFKGIGADQLNDEVRVFFLRDYLNQVIFSLSPAFRHNNHRVILECPESLRVQTHPSAFYQIISNLVMNSLVHGFPPESSGTINIGVNYSQDWLELSYRDNGVGIQPQFINQIFTPFFTTKRGHGGTGLGLYIVYTLVGKLDGSISCQSQSGQGVQFQILLPKSLVKI